MAKLYFRFATMGAGKTLEILKIAYNYEEQNKSVLLLTPLTDKRYGEGIVASRTGLERVATAIDEDTNIIKLVIESQPHCVLVDESQFLSKNNVLKLVDVVDELDIPVICYGLKNDFQNNLFPGSEALLLYADKIEEIKTICWYCDRKATMVLRMNNGKAVFDGEQIQIGGNESYIPTCRKCWMKKFRKEG